MALRTNLAAMSVAWIAQCAALLLAARIALGDARQPLRAGAAVADITPTEWPVSMVGTFEDRQATHAWDPLHARALVLDDGLTRIAIVVIDSCYVPRWVLDDAKRRISERTNIAADKMLMSATHTHTAPASRDRDLIKADPKYVEHLTQGIVRAVELAWKQREPAEIGWEVIRVPEELFNRRWFMKEDGIVANPFGQMTDRVRMNPPAGSPLLDQPAGPTDPDLSVVAVRAVAGRPIAVLANYSLHYVGGIPEGGVSADYFGEFARQIQDRLGPRDGDGPPMVGILSNGTSGDVNNVNFQKPRPPSKPFERMRAVASRVADRATEVVRRIEYHREVPLEMSQRLLTLDKRRPSEEQVARAKELLAADENAALPALARPYARRTLALSEPPFSEEIVLQAMRIGELGITAIPCEVFTEIGLELKAKSPLRPTFTIELANGHYGYLPTPRQHAWGGYETWIGTNVLGVHASEKITAALLGLLDEVSYSKRVEIGTRKQLVVDDQVLARTENVTRQLGTPEKANGGKPISFSFVDTSGKRHVMPAWQLFHTVYEDAERGVFQLWCRGLPDPSARLPDGRPDWSKVRYVYCESHDGLQFEYKADLTGLHSYGDFNLVVTRDEHETDPAHRYKIGYDGARSEFPNGACLAHSADGIQWTAYNHGRPVTGRAADFSNQVFWDERAKLYRLLTRTDYGAAGGVGEKRGARVMSNPDLKANPVNWTVERSWLLDREGPDEWRRRQLYMMTDWIHEDVHFGLSSVYEWPIDYSEGTETDHVKRHERDVNNFYIATSRDGVDWDWGWVYEQRPFVSRGSDGAWDKDLLFPSSRVLTRGDEHWIYYGGSNERHGTPGVCLPYREPGIGLAKLRLDGFVALRAGAQPGRIWTRPFELQGTQLELNIDASRGQWRVAVLDEAGKPLPGYSLDQARTQRGNAGVRQQPRWREHDSLAPLRGKTVRLLIELTDADLLAFQVRE